MQTTLQPVSDAAIHRSPPATSPTYSHDSLTSPRAGGGAAKNKANTRATTAKNGGWRNPGDHRIQHYHFEEATTASAQHAADVQQKHPHEFLHAHRAGGSLKDVASIGCVTGNSRIGDAPFKASLRDLSVLEKQLDAALESQSGSGSHALSHEEEGKIHDPVLENNPKEDLKSRVSKLESDLKCCEEIRQANELEKEMKRQECASLSAQIETLCTQRDELVRENQKLLQAQKERDIRDEESELDLQRSVEALRVSKDSLEQARLREKALEQVCLQRFLCSICHLSAPCEQVS